MDSEQFKRVQNLSIIELQDMDKQLLVAYIAEMRNLATEDRIEFLERVEDAVESIMGLLSLDTQVQLAIKYAEVNPKQAYDGYQSQDNVADAIYALANLHLRHIIARDVGR